MSDRVPRHSRRSFLLTLGTGGAVTAAALIAKPGSDPRPGAAEGARKRPIRGYQESAHVQRYYRTTKV